MMPSVPADWTVSEVRRRNRRQYYQLYLFPLPRSSGNQTYRRSRSLQDQKVLSEWLHAVNKEQTRIKAFEEIVKRIMRDGT